MNIDNDKISQTLQNIQKCFQFDKKKVIKTSKLLDKIMERKKETCKGIVFRGYRNKYFDGKKIVFKEELRILKRKSCSGCEECGYLWEAMHDTDNFYMENSIEHGSLYSIRFTNISQDWETGDFDDFDLEVFPITEEGEEMINAETQADKIEEKTIKINLFCKWCWAKYDVIRLPINTACPEDFDFATEPCRRCREELYYKGYEEGRKNKDKSLA